MVLKAVTAVVLAFVVSIIAAALIAPPNKRCRLANVGDGSFVVHGGNCVEFLAARGIVIPHERALTGER